MKNIFFYLFLGLPLGAWAGLLGLVLLLTVGTLGYMVGKGKADINTHVNMARLVIVIALLHSLAALYVFLK